MVDSESCRLMCAYNCRLIDPQAYASKHHQPNNGPRGAVQCILPRPSLPCVVVKARLNTFIDELPTKSWHTFSFSVHLGACGADTSFTGRRPNFPRAHAPASSEQTLTCRHSHSTCGPSLKHHHIRLPSLSLNAQRLYCGPTSIAGTSCPNASPRILRTHPRDPDACVLCALTSRLSSKP